MIAVDTNLLVYAHRRDATFHKGAKSILSHLAERPTPWAIPYHCLVEFHGVVTNGRVWRQPSTVSQSVEQVRSWTESPSLVLLTDQVEQLDQVLELWCTSSVTGPKVHDARIAALCIGHGVSELWTVDRDFSRFNRLTTRNPL